MGHPAARSRSNAASFAEAAAEELVTMQSLLTLLGQERRAIEEGKADALPALAAGKAPLMEVLSRCAERRARLLGVACVPQTAAGVRQLLGSDPGARRIWGDLIDAARQAAELNAGNRFLVNQCLAHVDRAIDALIGPRASLYSISGSASYGSGTPRNLALG